MRAWTGWLALLLVCCNSRAAGAEIREAGRRALEAEGYAGWVEGRHSGGAALGVSCRLRYRWLTGGLGLQGATMLFSSMASVSVLTGLSARTSLVRVDALAEAGLNGYTGVGSNFMTEDPGTEAVLPFVGGRASALLRVARGAGRGVEVWVGPSLQYAVDVASTRHTYSYYQDAGSGLFGDTVGQTVTRTVAIGQTRYSVMLVIATTLPL